MANVQNLRVPTSAEARELGRKGGLASAAKRAERKSFRDGLLMLLNEPLKDKSGAATDKTTQDAVIAGLIKKAIAGDMRAVEFIRDTIGEKPVDQVKVSGGNFEALEAAFSELDGGGKK